ncbi:MAG: GAF domain-containing protein [Pseudomonadota bacterium]
MAAVNHTEAMAEAVHTLHPVESRPTLPLLEARQQLGGLLAGESDLIANAANMSAFVNGVLPDLNWVGFYLLREGELVLGPFQGRPACVRIPLGRGVCGTSAQQRQTLRIADVHSFSGHIACDIRSRSELVIPVLNGDELVGVFDLDSPIENRFSPDDQNYVEELVDEFVRNQFKA